jgi:hypothetical protein
LKRAVYKERSTMRHRLIGGVLLAAAILLLPMALHAQGKKNKNDQPPIDSAKLTLGKYFGTLKSVPGSDRTFIVTVEIATLVPNGKGGNYKGTNAALQAISRLQNQINQAANQYNNARKPQQKANALNRLVNLQNQLATQIAVLQLQASALGPDGIPPGYKLVKHKRDVEFQHTENVKVRTLVLPQEFDDKGDIKKYTAAEKLKLRGKDKHLPGYESEPEKLNVGQKVRVTLVRRPKPPVDKEKEAERAKLTPEEKKAALKEDKEKEKELDEVEKKRQVNLIVIIEEAQEGASPGEKRKK